MDKYGGGDFIEGMQAHWQMEMEEKSVTVGGDHMAFPRWLCVTRASDTARSTLVVSGLRRRVRDDPFWVSAATKKLSCFHALRLDIC